MPQSPPPPPASTVIPPAAPEFQPPTPPSPPAPPPGSPSTPAPAGGSPFRVRRPGHPTRSPAAAALPGSPAGSAVEILDPLQSPSGATHSPGEDPEPLKLDKSLVKELARGLVLTITEVVHELLVKSEPGKHAELWIANDKEQKAIGDPVASMAIRHGGGVPGSPDVIDVIRAGVGLASYGIRNAKQAIQIRRRNRLEANRVDLPPEQPAAAA